MDGQRKISVYQFTVLTILFSLGSTLLVISSGLADELKQDAWLGAALGTLGGLALVALYDALAGRLPGMTLPEMSTHLLGRTAGRIFKLGYLFFNFYSAAALIWYVGNFLTINLFTETPRPVLMILYAAVMLYGTHLGLGTLARSAETSFLIFMLALAVVMLSLLPEARTGNLLPVLESGPGPLARASFTFVSFAYFPWISLLMIYPKHVTRPEACGKALYTAVLSSGAILTAVTALTVMVLGPDRTAIEAYPTYNLTMKINISHFFERIEALLVLLWLLAIFYQAVVSYYAAVTGLAQMVQVDDYRSLNLSAGLCLVPFALLIYPNVGYEHVWDFKVWPLFSLTYALWPAVLLPVAAIRGRRTNRHTKNGR
ncbi:spore germination protein KB [Paenibacillus tianmuensis]|uniref:Spore germination protein KB n=1 Tax=Paenibacillus tianmuensis TaxID=624147 RepID=A0A1G4Q9E5_9BACL|nr:endospore germination permease [Paenibacillus tianmuensis]SCW41210.1 spore germination protein KB [Paenibacillus tianmuensis]